MQKRGGNFFHFGHAVVHKIKARFFVRGLWILRILQPANKSVAQLKLHLAYIEDIGAVHFLGSGERKDTVKKSLRALLLGDSGRNRPAAQGIASKQRQPYRTENIYPRSEDLILAHAPTVDASSS